MLENILGDGQHTLTSKLRTEPETLCYRDTYSESCSIPPSRGDSYSESCSIPPSRGVLGSVWVDGMILRLRTGRDLGFLGLGS